MDQFWFFKMDQFRISIKYILDSFCALEDLVQKLFDRHSNVAKIKKFQFIRNMYMYHLFAYNIYNKNCNFTKWFRLFAAF